jgi:hypothetical protein
MYGKIINLGGLQLPKTSNPWEWSTIGIKLFPFWVNLHQQAINCWRALALKRNSPTEELVLSTLSLLEKCVYENLFNIANGLYFALPRKAAGLARDESGAIPTLRDVSRSKMYRGFLGSEI